LPHHKSCKKRLITSAKSRERNRTNKVAVRGALKNFRALEDGTEQRNEQLTDMYSRMDVLARKGIIPRKRADRMKSRLAALAAK